MSQPQPEQNEKKLNCLKELITIIITLIVFSYSNIFAVPQIKFYQENDNDVYKDVYLVKNLVGTDFAGVSMITHPQILITYKDNVILIAHLNNYYETEYLIFDSDNKAIGVKTNQEYCTALIQYIRTQILEQIGNSLGKQIQQNIESDFRIYDSILAGIQYKNMLISERKKMCIIEDGGIAIGYTDIKNKIISNRLYEMEIDLANDEQVIYIDSKVSQIINTVSNEILKLYKETKE